MQLQVKEWDKRHKKGTIFAVPDKIHFENGIKGYIITSKETLIEQANRIHIYHSSIKKVNHLIDHLNKRLYRVIKSSIRHNMY